MLNHVVCSPPSGLSSGGVGWKMEHLVEYDLDNADEDFLQQLNATAHKMDASRLELLLLRLEILCSEATERALAAAD